MVRPELRHRSPFGWLFGLAARTGRTTLAVSCLAASLAIGLLDTALPPPVGLSAFYLVPVLVAAARDASSGASSPVPPRSSPEP